MDKKVLDYAVEKTHELMEAGSCSAEAKAAAQAWLNAVGTPEQAEETKRYLAELEQDIVTVDQLIELAGSPLGEKIFGAQKAKEVEEHGKQIKAQGGKYCDCPACSAVQAILKEKDALLAQ